MGNKAQWGRIDLYEKMGSIGKSIGLEWGGDFKSIKDRSYFQWTSGFTLDQLRNGWYPADSRAVIEDEFVVAVNKLVEKGVINSPNYWVNNKTYKVEYVRELIKNSAKKLK